jgi:hypothetical protein
MDRKGRKRPLFLKSRILSLAKVRDRYRYKYCGHSRPKLEFLKKLAIYR